MEEEHTPYEQRRKRPCDFVVKYRFLTAEEGGRKTGTPAQGYRSDFLYPEDENQKQLWAIYPEFLNEKGEVILSKSERIPPSGKALMWILRDELLPYHKERIKIGKKAFFVEGPTKVAECEVIEIVRLAQ